MARGAAACSLAFRRLSASGLDAEVVRFTARALMAAVPGPSGPLVDAGIDAGLDHSAATERAATCFLTFATFNLSDDLSDGDCDYLPTAAAQSVVLVLGSLATRSLRDLGLPRSVESQVLSDLTEAEAAQVLECSTSAWDAARLQRVTDGIAGAQWSAYLRVMWAGTPLEDLAPQVARQVGRVALLADDVAGGDVRWTSLSADDRGQVLREALEHAERLRTLDAKVTRDLLSDWEPVLRGELARTSAPQSGMNRPPLTSSTTPVM